MRVLDKLSIEITTMYTIIKGARTSAGHPGGKKLSVQFAEVFNAELTAIKGRRKNTNGAALGLPDLEERLTVTAQKSKAFSEVLKKLKGAPPAVDQNKLWNDAVAKPKAKQESDSEADIRCLRHSGLVGLAFSGGGIRSATFNLGILQALEKSGLWSSIDYLSTVSGGGYLGSCLSSLYAAEEELTDEQRKTGAVYQSEEFPFKHIQGKKEPDAFRHLRNNANYLAPNGFLDLIRAPIVLLRGVFVNVMSLLPIILLASMTTILANPKIGDLNTSLINQLFKDNSLPYSGPFSLTLTLLSTVLVIFAAYPLVRRLARWCGYFENQEWERRNRWEKILGWLALGIGISAFFEFQAVAITWFHDLVCWLSVGDGSFTWRQLVPSTGAVSALIMILSANKLTGASSGFLGKLGLWALGLLGFGLVWLIYLGLSHWAIYSPTNSTYFLVYYGLIAVVVWLYTFLIVDVNATSLHNFYRDRLSKAYLISPKEGKTMPHNDTQKLSGLNTWTAPYHLINAALNVSNPDEAFKRGRQADTFTFSKDYIGGPLTDYCTTKAMEDVRPRVNLGTAMAISGAAFAATAGKATIKPLAFLMAMFNVRLNYWLPNPKFAGEPKNKAAQFYNRYFGRVGPGYFFRELTMGLSTKSRHVDVSDGGHFDNLGAYELLRRECRLIIVGDGECDPELKFDAVSELVRLAQIDMGIWIDMEGLDKIRNGDQHYAIGTIHYGDDRQGVLLYLKSSLLRDDSLEAALPSTEAFLTSEMRTDDRQYDYNPYIAHYKSRHPDFPHQTTADQFFDEKQFECYRALGFMVAQRSIGDWQVPARADAEALISYRPTRGRHIRENLSRRSGRARRPR